MEAMSSMADRRRRRSFFDYISDYFEDFESWAERMEEAFLEQPSWNCQACTIEPLCNIAITPREVVVTADLPFVKADTVKVEPADDDVLEITAEMRRRVCFDDFGVKHWKGEFSMFRCEVYIPVPVEMGSLRKSFRKGFLEARLRRKRVHEIKVE